MRELDPLELPLEGLHLIEAGAGTGKTYTITFLYLRLLLERGLNVEEILVVTFTEAAAAELGGRIRGKLLEMQNELETGRSGDTLLARLARRVASKADAAARIGDAIRRLDQACVFTIHGFCARALAEHAFESGAPFETEYLTADSPVLRSAVEDFWRSRFYVAPADEVRRLQEMWKEPHRLWQSAAPLLRQENPLWVPPLAVTDLRRRETQLKAKGRRDELYRAALLREVVDYVGVRFAEVKRDRRLLSFDDLLQNLDSALEGTAGAALRARIRRQHPVALIDEFQDTDPVQYRIFRRLYAGHPDSGLFLIGDPKQAIYGFRGADIYTYRRACQDTQHPEGAHSLSTNWRSSPAYLRALNALFERRNAFLLDWIQYRQAEPGRSAEQGLSVARDTALAPFQFSVLARTDENSNRNRRIAAEWARSTAAMACAREIRALLADRGQAAALLEGRPLQAGDVAVLVPTGREAGLMRQALQSLGLGCVLHSRESVAATEEAGEIARILAAVIEPRSGSRLRAALSTRLLGADAAELEALEADARRWELLVARFEHYREQWIRHGFAVMYRSLLCGEEIPRRVLGVEDGERRMTDLLHLGELLQAMERELFGMEALLRRLVDLRADPDGDNDAEQLRLESDENLIQIVTIHKSKGLEYPIVFVPFPWFARPTRKKPPFLFHDDVSGLAGVYLGDGTKPGSDHHYELAERDRLAEDLRLLYVALTRAKYRCHLFWGRVEGASKSALAYLLHGHGSDRPADAAANDLDRLGDTEIVDAIRQRFSEVPELVSVAMLDSPAANVVGPRPNGDRLRARLEARSIVASPSQSWESSSYTSLLAARSPHSEGPDHDRAVSRRAQRDDPGPERGDIFAFPRGARAGELIHALFEELDFQASGDEVLAPLVRRHLEGSGFEADWLPVLEGMVGEVLDTVLERESGLRLRDIAKRQKIPELEFHFPLENVSVADLDRLLTRSGRPALAAGSAPARTLKGVMHGFIDLVLEHQGRYYLLDYKSNHLGDSVEDYAPEQLGRAMHEHRYDLQYLIYVVALHRYLRYRMPGYDFERDFGGVFYLFVRGMRKEMGPTRGVHFVRPEKRLVEELDHLFANGKI